MTYLCSRARRKALFIETTTQKLLLTLNSTLKNIEASACSWYHHG